MKKGFSLIEILVSIAIIIIISGLGLQTFSTARQRSRLDEDVAKVVFAIRQAQNTALAPSKSETIGLNSNESLCSIGVRLHFNNIIQPVYKKSITDNSCGSYTTYGTADKLNYSKFSTGNEIYFEFDIPFANTSSNSSVTLSLGNLSKTVSINFIGLINVQ
jgi:prepilin-type N-terminal cleavage/methylation domain-containing protein